MSQQLRDYFFLYRHHLSVLFSAFLLGLLLGGSLYWHAKRQVAVKQEEIEKVSLEKQELLRKLAASEVETKVLRGSQINLKKTLEDREATIAEQETSLEFYRKLMVVDDKKEGLALNTYTITHADIQGAYHYRFNFVQYANQHANIKGKMNVRLEGNESGKFAVYYLRDLLVAPNKNFGELQFRYFQVLEGDVILPKNFQPQHIVIVVELNTTKEPWQHKMPWIIQE